MDEPAGSIFKDGTVFRSLFLAYPDGLLLVDLDGVIRLANPAAVELLGYAESELVGLPVDDLVPDAIRPRHASHRRSYAAHPRARPMGTQMELVARRRDASEVMVEIALSPLQDHGLPYVVAAVRGVGAYPRVKQALQRARYAEYLAKFGHDAVDAADSSTLIDVVPRIAAEALQVETARVLLLEPSAQDLRIAAGVGLPAGEAVGQRVGVPDGADLGLGRGRAGGPRADAPRNAEPPMPPAGIGAASAHERSVTLADRGRTVGLLQVRSQAPLNFGEDELRFLQSLSSMLATVLQRQKSEEALSHAQRLESVGQLTGGVAHDFNNLLTIISGTLQMMETAPQYAGDAFLQQLVSAAGRATRRGADLTGKLLAFSRRQMLQPTVVDVAALLGSLRDMLRRTLDQRIVISLEARAALCLADPIQLESALLNVAINARDAMPQGGSIAIVCRTADALPEGLDPEDAPSHGEGFVTIAVTDTGQGMSAAVRERAFEPFFTTKETGRGTGLGLSTVYGFAKQSRGAVHLRSAPGAGTTVTLYLPRVDPATVVGEEDDLPVHGMAPAGLRVLLVEDDPEVRQVVCRFLASMACQVVACADAQEALRALAGTGGFDLLITDVLLGSGRRGTELAAAALQAQPGLAVLLMSGFSGELLDVPVEQELLRKPFTAAQLGQAMARALRTLQ